MTVFVVYARDTGRLVSVNTCADALYPDMPRPAWPLGYLEIPTMPINVQTWLPTHYVDVGTSTVVQCKPMTASVPKTTIAADANDTVTLTGLPSPCSVSITGTITAGPLDVPDGELALTSNVPGDFLVSVTAPPVWLPWSVTIHAI